jgi:hypothetical protein
VRSSDSKLTLFVCLTVVKHILPHSVTRANLLRGSRHGSLSAPFPRLARRAASQRSMYWCRYGRAARRRWGWGGVLRVVQAQVEVRLEVALVRHERRRRPQLVGVMRMRMGTGTVTDMVRAAAEPQYGGYGFGYGDRQAGPSQPPYGVAPAGRSNPRPSGTARAHASGVSAELDPHATRTQDDAPPSPTSRHARASTSTHIPANTYIPQPYGVARLYRYIPFPQPEAHTHTERRTDIRWLKGITHVDMQDHPIVDGNQVNSLGEALTCKRSSMGAVNHQSGPS